MGALATRDGFHTLYRSLQKEARLVLKYEAMVWPTVHLWLLFCKAITLSTSHPSRQERRGHRGFGGKTREEPKQSLCLIQTCLYRKWTLSADYNGKGTHKSWIAWGNISCVNSGMSQMLKVSETCQVLMELLEIETIGHLPRAAWPGPPHLSGAKWAASFFSSFPLGQNKGCSEMFFRHRPDSRAIDQYLKICWVSDAREEVPLASASAPRGFLSSADSNHTGSAQSP